MDIKLQELKKTVLIYGLNQAEQQKLKMLAEKAGIVCRFLQDNQTTFPISQLLYQENLPVGPVHPVDGKFALLDGFAGQEHLGAALINQAASGVVKAAHTLHNSSWPFADLCSAISMEHEYMTGRNKE